MDLLIPQFQTMDFPVGAYRIATTATVSLHDSQKTYDFRGDTSSGDFGNLDDRRIVIFKR